MNTAPINENYLEFDLDEQIFEEIEKLADKAKVTPFEMCVILLEEHVASSAGREPRKSALLRTQTC